MSQAGQPRSGVYGQGHGGHQRPSDEYLIGQLEQHYLTHLQSSGNARGFSPSGSLLGSGLAPGSSLRRDSLEMPRIADPYGWMNAEQRLLQRQQEQRQLAGPSRLGQAAAEQEADAQPALNLDELSALMQAGRPQALPGLHSQPPLTLAQTYLTQLTRIQPLRGNTAELPGASDSHPSYDQFSSFQGGIFRNPAWVATQTPLQTLQGHGNDPSTAEARMHDDHMLASMPKSQAGPPGDQNPHFHRHHPSCSDYITGI